MTIELHIWGPAFGLPSIDASCLAAIAYLRECLPLGSWTLVAASDPSLNPLNELPALRNGTAWIGGFRGIVGYLRTLDDSWDLDRSLSPDESGDREAYTSFLESRGQPLLDLSLYVSSENYTECTSPALGKLLSWPSSWFVPHRMREKARKTSEHLGLSGLDVDSAQNEKSDDGLSAQIPKSLKKPRQTVSALLGYDLKRSKFRMDAVTTDFLAPLDEVLGNGEWLIADQASSADCLAVGYLALMQIDGHVPQPWLRVALEGKFSRLGRWARVRQQEWFPGNRPHGLQPQVVDGVSNSSNTAQGVVRVGEKSLPWKAGPTADISEVINSLVLNVIGAIPYIKAQLKPVEINLEHAQSRHGLYRRKQRAIGHVLSQELWYSQVLTSAMLSTIISGVLVYNGFLRVPSWRPQPSLPRRFGDAGVILGLG